MKASLAVSDASIVVSVAVEGRTGGRQRRINSSLYLRTRPSFAVGGSADAMVIGVSAMRQLTYVCGGRLEGPPQPTGARRARANARALARGTGESRWDFIVRI